MTTDPLTNPPVSSQMPFHVHIFSETQATLWGLTNVERIRRELESEVFSRIDRGNPQRVVGYLCTEDLDNVAPNDNLLLLRGDYLYDVRVLVKLVASTETLLRTADDRSPPVVVAACVRGDHSARVKAHIQGQAVELPTGIKTVSPESLVPASQIRLKKAHAPFVLPITCENAGQLESHLFRTAYKGVTDLVTKWVWPKPAEAATRLCVRFGISPNQVTAMSWLLAAAAGLLFYQGYLGAGLAVGWVMTFLDTVDGKLARVTVTSSPMGNYFDHILDLLHPPLWYLAWGQGLSSLETSILPADLTTLMGVIFGSYIIGRLVEGIFSRWIGRFGIYSWQRIDSFNRLVTARRNPCLIIMSVGLTAGRPDLALEAVALWSFLSTLFLLVRLAMGIFANISRGPLHSWLTEIDPSAREQSLAARWFTQ